MTSSTLIILNPHAGGGRAGTVWREIEPILWNHMGDLIVAVTQHPNEVARHIEQAYTVGVRRVIALGGDGTNHSLVNALAVFNQQHPDEPMIYGNIPVGTGRDWARGQGLPFTEAKPIADWIIGAKPTPTDIGLITTDNTQREYFLNIASAGLGGEVARRVNHLKKYPWTFLLSTVMTTLTYHPQTVQVQVDGQDWYEGGAYVVAVANGSTFGHGMRIAPNADVADGLFEIILVKGVSRLTVLTALRRVYDASHLTHPGVLSTRGRSITVTRPKTREIIDMELDGEYHRGHEINFSVQPGALQMLL
ncbi:MAG: diacylglycerol kinase family lipid kinase [Chloroflexi bacterium]|uniref:diacylglycerol/lipid kinase family protein n=1 Tax=Candidatus Flexifilum breve TaxID=3140694 RepID=UPI0031363C98|nr:diacylglycerol kinase family lipid kinase [Chloroflexota bacterium]